ncbi:hypothetical protein DIPPA_08543 [Diplonema papillatum]|nr:hypothetical protein DIPPA_08543 [Diplonema papillatum]
MTESADLFFSGVRAGFHGTRPVRLQRLVTAHGGTVSRIIGSDTTHCVVVPGLRSVPFPNCAPVPVVSEQWLADSVAARRPLPTEGYLVRETPGVGISGRSTPTPAAKPPAPDSPPAAGPAAPAASDPAGGPLAAGQPVSSFLRGVCDAALHPRAGVPGVLDTLLGYRPSGAGGGGGASQGECDAARLLLREMQRAAVEPPAKVRKTAPGGSDGSAGSFAKMEKLVAAYEHVLPFRGPSAEPDAAAANEEGRGCVRGLLQVDPAHDGFGTAAYWAGKEAALRRLEAALGVLRLFGRRGAEEAAGDARRDPAAPPGDGQNVHAVLVRTGCALHLPEGEVPLALLHRSLSKHGLSPPPPPAAKACDAPAYAYLAGDAPTHPLHPRANAKPRAKPAKRPASFLKDHTAPFPLFLQKPSATNEVAAHGVWEEDEGECTTAALPSGLAVPTLRAVFEVTTVRRRPGFAEACGLGAGGMKGKVHLMWCAVPARDLLGVLACAGPRPPLAFHAAAAEALRRLAGGVGCASACLLLCSVCDPAERADSAQAAPRAAARRAPELLRFQLREVEAELIKSASQQERAAHLRVLLEAAVLAEVQTAPPAGGPVGGDDSMFPPDVLRDIAAAEAASGDPPDTLVDPPFFPHYVYDFHVDAAR